MYALLNVAFALLAGLLMTRIFSRWRLPDVTAFLVAGVLIGPFCLGRLGITGVGFAAYEDVAAVNAVYAKYFEGDCPARSAVQVGALPKGALVEIEAIAVKK